MEDNLKFFTMNDDHIFKKGIKKGHALHTRKLNDSILHLYFHYLSGMDSPSATMILLTKYNISVI